MKNAIEINFLGPTSVFAIRLKKLMSSGSKITQEDLGNATGLTRQAIGNYLNGATKPDIESLYKMAKFFNVSADYLIGISDIKSVDMQDKEMSKALGLNGIAIENLKEAQLKIKKIVELSKTQSNTEEYFNLNNELPLLEGTAYAINTLLSDNSPLGIRAVDTMVEYLLFDESENYNINLNNTTYSASGKKVGYFLINELHNKLKALKNNSNRSEK